MTTLLEHRFNFTADDLAANREGVLSEDQQLRLCQMLWFYSVMLMGGVVGALFLVGVMTYIFFRIGQRDEIDPSRLMVGGALFILPLFLIVMIQVRVVYRWWMAFKAGEVKVIQTHFTQSPSERKATKIQHGVEYHQQVGNLKFIFNERQNPLIEAHHPYRLYYFPVPIHKGSYLIVGVEAVDIEIL